MSSKTDRWTTTYTCQCGAGTMVEDSEQYAHTWHIGPVSTRRRFECQKCAAEWVITEGVPGPLNAPRILLVPVAVDRARTDANTKVYVLERAIAESRLRKAQALAAKEVELIDPAHTASRASEHRYLVATYGERGPYASYVSRRKRVSFEEVVRGHLMSSGRVTGGDEALHESLAVAIHDRDQAQKAALDATVPFTGKEIAES